eukprot:MONOS_6713.1-p1 / transcript=MONOS_6713.1 / gene=MONOS_6713 / organism=Monocercomonoides_exilis_PA203 / gene_product=unspecified product / transcript_product=unspecified product / location=Mono_scaffold00216:48528-49850(-) / protein_length=440 / sequence_SO=supercontig / SO=protein_coding / is_pseudo=false
MTFLNSDIFCLQEVDLLEILKKNFEGQYDFCFFNRPSTFQLLQGRSSKRIDGVAVLLKKSKFKLICQQIVDYNRLSISIDPEYAKFIFKDAPLKETYKGENFEEAKADDEESNFLNKVATLPNFLQVFLTDNIGCLLCVEIIDPSIVPDADGTCNYRNIMFLASTHLYWDPVLDALKTEQMRCLLRELSIFRRKLLKELQTKEGEMAVREIGTFVCGDFNSLPDSNVYKLCTHSSLQLADYDVSKHEQLPKKESEEKERESDVYSMEEEILWKGIKEEKRKEQNEMDSLSHSYGSILPLCSSYHQILGAEPKYTNFTAGFKGCLDYVLFSPGTIGSKCEHGEISTSSATPTSNSSTESSSSLSLSEHPSSSSSSSSASSSTSPSMTSSSVQSSVNPTLSCVGILLPPNDELLSQHVALPSCRCGSDHISLQSFFKLFLGK